MTSKAISVAVASMAALIFQTSGGLRSDGQPGAPVREIAVDTLRDVAVAVYDARHPVIYYNPRLMERFGPQLAAFFMQHEYGHINYHHTRANALAGRMVGISAVLQARELEADCFAAASLARTNAAAVSAAVRYFSRLGPFRYDTDHPTGAQRAAKILACLPSPQTLRPDIAPKEPPAEPALSGFSVTTKTLVNGGLGRDVSIWVAGKLVGTLSNRRQPMKLEVQGMPAGTYPYRIAVNLYALDDMLQFNPSGTVLGDGELTIRGGETFAVELAPGSSPVLILEQ